MYADNLKLSLHHKANFKAFASGVNVFSFIIHFVSLHSMGTGGSLCMISHWDIKLHPLLHVLKVQSLIKQRNNFTFTMYLVIATQVCDALATLI